MKAPNGYGNITKLSGNRRRPFWVRITTGWQITENGKQKQLTKTLGYFSTRKEAMIALADYNKSPYDLTNTSITFSQVWDIWSPKHFERHTSAAGGLKSAYKKCTPLYDMKMTDIKKAHMQNILDSISHMSEESQIKVKTVFKNTFKYALENDIVQKDYSEFLTITPKKRKKESKHFNESELKLILNNLDFEVEFPQSKKTYATLNLTYSVLLLLYTGMRITELLELKTEDIDLKENVIYIHGTKTDNADRTITIHKDILDIIKNKMSGIYLIENKNGKPIKYDPYKKYFFDVFMEHLGLSHTPHATRHTFISRMDTLGVSSNSVLLKRIVGHANKNVTETYTHKDIKEIKAAIDRYSLF